MYHNKKYKSDNKTKARLQKEKCISMLKLTDLRGRCFQKQNFAESSVILIKLLRDF